VGETDRQTDRHTAISFPFVLMESDLQFFSSVPSNGHGPSPLGCHGSVKQFKWLITRWGKFKADLGRSRITIVDGAREEGKFI